MALAIAYSAGASTRASVFAVLDIPAAEEYAASTPLVLSAPLQTFIALAGCRLLYERSQSEIIVAVAIFSNSLTSVRLLAQTKHVCWHA